jgi:hypothetical protein
LTSAPADPPTVTGPPEERGWRHHAVLLNTWSSFITNCNVLQRVDIVERIAWQR